MAEYYPLLARAVAGMRSAPAEQRRAIYDRARQALLGQLRTMQPPVPEESILRESTALDEAIARVEADLVTASPAAVEPAGEGAPPRPEPPVPTGSAEPGPADTVAPAAKTDAVAPVVSAPVVTPAPIPDAAPPSEPKTPEPPQPQSTPVAPSPAVITAKPVSPPRAPMPVSRPAPARPAADALTRIVAERGPVPPPLRATRNDAEPAEGAARPGPLPSAPRLQVPSFDDALVVAEAAAAAADADGSAPPADEVAKTAALRDEPARPLAPRPVVRERFNPRFLILAVVGLLVVSGIAYAAWRLRDKPETLAKSRAAMLAAQQAEQQSTKVSTRVGAASADAAASAGTDAAPAATASGAAATQPTPAAPAPAAVAASQPSASSTPADVPAQPAPAATTTSPTQTATPSIPVAQRAAFLVDAPDDPAKVKTYVGTVVWSTDSTTSGTNQQLVRTVRAEVDVPDAAVKMSMVFQKNDEAQFPASHTIELRFTQLPNNTLGPVKQINVPQMRKDDSQTGDPLIGLPVTITDNYFLVGLSRGDATQRNLDLIKTRNWFDIPLLLASGKVAKITFEKGGPGEQAINDVVQSWQ